MALKASLGAGNVSVTLDGEDYTLKPTLRAAQTISRMSGGIIGALQAVGRLELDAVTQIIAAGLGKDAKEVAEAVWVTGLSDLTDPVTKYLTVLANGGRPQSGGSEEENPPSA